MLTEPNSICPVAWATWNESADRLRSERMRLEAEELALEPYAVEVVELPPAVQDLTLAVRRAASELHGTSEKGDRIALQLVTALARFAKETNT